MAEEIISIPGYARYAEKNDGDIISIRSKVVRSEMGFYTSSYRGKLLFLSALLLSNGEGKLYHTLRIVAG